ncbi:MAG: sigma-70 family RNA polymerase sigma factor [bacterium]|nr:sigma-70 family RNA polymerase sigma factor [bacterium]
MATILETIGVREEIHHDGDNLLILFHDLENASDETEPEELSTEKEECTESIPKNKQLALFNRAKCGDADAAGELIRSVTKFIHYINKKTGSRFTEDEAVEIGYLGIAKAFDSFDPDREVLFSTHAYNHIRWAILNEIKRKKRITDHEKSCEGIAEMFSGGRDPSLIAEEKIDSEEQTISYRKLLAFLDKRCASIMLYRSGAMDGTAYTQEETAAKIGITKQRVSQLEHGAKSTIHTVIENNGVLPISEVVNKIERDEPRSANVIRETHGINKYRETHTVMEMMERYGMSQSGITTLRAQAKSRLLLASGIISTEHDLQHVINMLKSKDKGKRDKQQTIESLGSSVRIKIIEAIHANPNALHRDVLTSRLGLPTFYRIATQSETAEGLGCTEANVQMVEMLAIPKLCTHYLLRDNETTQTQKGYVALLEILNTTKDSDIRKAVLRILDSSNVGRIGEAFEALPVARQGTLLKTLNPENTTQEEVGGDRKEIRRVQYEQKIELLDILETMTDSMGIPLYESPTIQRIAELNMTSASIEAITEEDEVKEIASIIEDIQNNQKKIGVFLRMRLGIGREKKATYKEIQAETRLPLQTVHTMLRDALHLLDKKLSYNRKQKQAPTPQ